MPLLLALESIIAILATYKLSVFYLVSVAEQAGLSLTWSQALETVFLMSRPILRFVVISTSDCAGPYDKLLLGTAVQVIV